jgi:hypothetical protein
MCKVTVLKSPTCPHRWLIISKPCEESRGFNSCPLFQNNRAITSSLTGIKKAKPKTCPQCDLKGEYDRNMIRVVERERVGVKIGKNADRTAPGVEVVVWCCGIM